MSHRAFTRSRQTGFRAAAIGLGLTLLVAALAAAAGAASNRAPAVPGIVAPSGQVDGNVRYSDRDTMQIWSTSTDPDRDMVSYRYKVFLFGSPANLYDSGWKRESMRGWGVAVSVPDSAPIRAGLTYVLTAQARDTHGALSPTAAVAYAVFSNKGKASTQSASWYQQEYNLASDRSAYNSGLTQAGTSYLRSKIADLAMKPNDRCYNGDLPAGLRSQMITRSTGFLRNVTLMGAAMNSLQTAMREIMVKEPVLAYVLQSSGGLCYRGKRPAGGGPSTSLSNHSWGLALDVNYGGGAAETARGDHNASMYLYRFWRYMHTDGWYWGGGFSGSNQDNMHFEASTNLMDYLLFLGVAHHA